MQTKHIVAYTHKVCTQADVLQRGMPFFREENNDPKDRLFPLYLPIPLLSCDNSYLLGVVDDSLELVYCFHELHDFILVGDFLR